MNRPVDSFARPLVAALLAASGLAYPSHALAASHSSTPTEEISEPDQLALARQAVDRGDNAEALSRYVRVLAVRPHDLTALVGAGNAAVELGDFSAGLAFFGRAEEVDPHNGRVKAGLASALAQTEQPGAALKLFDEAVALGVPEAEIAGDRGLAWDLRGNPRRAQRDYALALSTKPDHEVTMRLALSQAISGDRESALRTLGPWLSKQDQGAWRTRAFVLAITGDSKGASQAAGAVLPAAQATAMTPFFARLASLNPAQKAMAANFGYLPGDQPPAVQRALSTSSAMANADTRGRMAFADRAAAPRPTAAAIAAPPRASAPVTPPVAQGPAPAAAVAQGTVSVASITPAVASARPAVAASVGPKPVASSPVAPTLPDAQEVKRASTAPTPAAVAKPALVTSPARPVEPEPAVATKVAASSLPTAPARPTIVAAATGSPATKPAPAASPRPPPPAAAPSLPKPAVAPTANPAAIVTLSPAEIAMLQAETAADAEAEARADHENIAMAVPAPAPAPAPVKLPGRNDWEVVAKEPSRPPASAKPTEARTVEPARVATPAPARAIPPKPPAPAVRLIRIVSLPLPAAVARSFAALPHGSALSADAVVDKATAAPKVAPKKVELAADDVDETKPQKPTNVKSAPAGAEKKDLDNATGQDADKTADMGAKIDAKGVKDSDKLAARDAKTTGGTDKPGKAAEGAAKAKTAKFDASAKPRTALAEGTTKGKGAVTEDDSKAKVKTASSTNDLKAKTKTASTAEETKAKTKTASAAEETRIKAKTESAADGPKEKAVGERFWVQVAGGSNKADLDKAWEKLRAGPARSVLAGHTPSTAPLRATNRLLVGPFVDMSEAQSFVNKLAGAGTSSFTFKSAPDQKVDKLQDQ